MNQRPKLVVLTPIKNEAWILPRFLATATRWADAIIVADQDSTDDSARICKGWEKVTLIRNDNPSYDEASRQRLLISTARKLVPEPRILLALDADEILAADSQLQPGWSQMIHAEKGTVIYFEKPDICQSADASLQCVRFPDHYWPLAFVDDGSDHEATLIHSRRIPCPSSAPEIRITDVKFLHYNLLRKRAHESKRRMYGVIEALSKTMKWSKRIIHYRANINWSAQGPVENCPESWFQNWEADGINMRTVEDATFNWYDIEVLKKMGAFGDRRFYWEDIWSFDWEACRQWAIANGNMDVPSRPIVKPTVFHRALLWMFQRSSIVARDCFRAIRK